MKRSEKIIRPFFLCKPNERNWFYKCEIGVESIYQHLYEFGTYSMFVAMGKKLRRYNLNKEGELVAHKSILLKFVMDE